MAAWPSRRSSASRTLTSGAGGTAGLVPSPPRRSGPDPARRRPGRALAARGAEAAGAGDSRAREHGRARLEGDPPQARRSSRPAAPGSAWCTIPARRSAGRTAGRGLSRLRRDRLRAHPRARDRAPGRAPDSQPRQPDRRRDPLSGATMIELSLLEGTIEADDRHALTGTYVRLTMANICSLA